MSTEFVEALKKDPRGFLAKNRVGLSRTGSALPSSHYAYMHAVYNDDQRKYLLTMYASDARDRVRVQYLPFRYDSGLYIQLQSSPEIFVTAKLTGCDLAIRGSGGAAVRVVHMNFAESSEARSSTLSAYKSDGYKLFTAGESYYGETVVLGVHKGAWQIYAQDSAAFGKVTQIL